MQKFQFQLRSSLSNEEFTAWSGSSPLSLARVWAKNRPAAFKSHCHVREGQVTPYLITGLCWELSNLSLLQEGVQNIFHPTAITVCCNWVPGTQLASFCLAILIKKIFTEANMALCTTVQPHNNPVSRSLQHFHSMFDFAKYNCLTLTCRCFDDEPAQQGKGERLLLSCRDHWEVPE